MAGLWAIFVWALELTGGDSDGIQTTTRGFGTV